MKLHRSVLFAGMLAFGLAACGDDVQVVEPTPPPPPPLQVSMSPSNATINADEVADFAVTVSGGAVGAAASWTCASSATGVATVAVTATGCRATGVANGNASITATVTKGDQSTSAAAQVSVREVTLAEISIFAINKGGTTASISAIMGQLDVIVNITRNDENPTGVDLVARDVLTGAETLVARQTFSAAAPGETIEDAAGNVVQQVTLSFNTAEYSLAEGVATVKHKNGQHIVFARLTGVGTGGTQTRASQESSTLRFTNVDAVHVTQEFVTVDGTTLNDARAMDGTGLVWHGGPNWVSIDISAIPVIYTRVGTDGQPLTVASMTLASFCLQGASTISTAPYTFVRHCRPTGPAPAFTPIDFEGAATPAFSGVGSDGNLIAFATSPPFASPFANANQDPAQNPVPVIYPIRIDTRPPSGAVLKMAMQGSLRNRENWGNASYSLTSGYTVPGDGGIGLPVGSGPPAFAEASFRVRTGTTVVDGHTFDDNLRTLASLDNSVNNSTYNAQVQTCDRLLNCRVTSMSSHADKSDGGMFVGVDATADSSHSAASFGVDKGAPVMSRGDIGPNAAITTQQTFINAPSAQVYEPQAVDTVSGFAAPIVPGIVDAALAHNLVRVTGAPGSETLTRAILIGGASSGADPNTTVTGPFATANAGSFVVLRAANGTPRPLRTLSYSQTPTSISTFLTPTAYDGGTGAAGYYIYQAQARDKAGNLSNVIDYQVYFSNLSIPELTGLVAQGTYTGGAQATFPGTAQDSVEIHEGSFDLQYPANGPLPLTRLVYERPNPTVSTLFDDVITMPASVNFTAPFFIRQMQSVTSDISVFPIVPDTSAADGGHEPVAGMTKPNRIQGRVYNGINSSLADSLQQNHRGTVGPGTPGVSGEASTGTSPRFNVPILSTQVQTGVDFATSTPANRRVLQFAIVSYQTSAAGTGSSAGLVTATIRVRVSGRSGTFLLPFGGGLMIARRGPPTSTTFVEPLNVTVTPLFSAPFPTLDNGAHRDFDWSFTLVRPSGTVLDLHAIGMTSAGDALMSRLTRITFTPSLPAGTSPTAWF